MERKATGQPLLETFLHTGSFFLYNPLYFAVRERTIPWVEVQTATRLMFAEETVSDAWDEALELIQANQEETGQGNGEDFQPDRARYEQFSKLDLIRAFTARFEGGLVGYALFFIAPHLHYPKLITAQQDVIYVTPEHRGRGAVRFIRWTDERLKAEGVKAIHRGVSPKLDHGRTLERMGYKLVDIGYWRTF